jgi:hypothetical protein
MKKGFVLTLDSMLALVTAAAFVTAIMYFVTAPTVDTGKQLYGVADDFLTVADRDGGLTEAVLGNSTRLSTFLKEMPVNLCVNVTVYNRSGGVLFSNSTDCPTPHRFVIAKRTIVNNTSDYMAKARVWQK